MKARKIYSLDRVIAKKVNIATLNPTVKAIMKGLWMLTSDKDFIGFTGNEVLEFCIKNRMWTTRQTPDKYITTWAFYIKTLKTLGVVESGTTDYVSNEEYLEEESEEQEEKTVYKVEGELEDEMEEDAEQESENQS